MYSTSSDEQVMQYSPHHSPLQPLVLPAINHLGYLPTVAVDYRAKAHVSARNRVHEDCVLGTVQIEFEE